MTPEGFPCAPAVPGSCPVRAAFAAFPVILLYRRFQPCLDETQKTSIADATGDALHEFGMRNLAKIVREIGIHDFPMPLRQQLMGAVDRILRTASRPVVVPQNLVGRRIPGISAHRAR